MRDASRVLLAMRAVSNDKGLSLVVPLPSLNYQTSAGSSVKWDTARAKALFTLLRNDKPLDSRPPAPTASPPAADRRHGRLLRTTRLLRPVRCPGFSGHLRSATGAGAWTAQRLGWSGSSRPDRGGQRAGGRRRDRRHPARAAAPGCVADHQPRAGRFLRGRRANPGPGGRRRGPGHPPAARPGRDARRGRTARRRGAAPGGVLLPRRPSASPSAAAAAGAARSRRTRRSGSTPRTWTARRVDAPDGTPSLRSVTVTTPPGRAPGEEASRPRAFPGPRARGYRLRGPAP